MTFREVVNGLARFGYELNNKGRTSGSSVVFVRPGMPGIRMHRPHGHKCLLLPQVKAIYKALIAAGLISADR